MIAAPDPHIRSRSRVLLKAALVVLPFGLIAACERKADDNYAPVKTRTIPMSRTDLTPIETRLYNYVGDTWTEKEKFITDGKPPLRFSFPAAYYGHKNNFDGGAQPRINIRLDPNTLLPSSVRFEQDGPDRPIRVIPNRGRLNSVGITIFSNVVLNHCPVEAGDTAFPLEEAAPGQPLRIRRRKVVEIDTNFVSHLPECSEVAGGHLSESPDNPLLGKCRSEISLRFSRGPNSVRKALMACAGA